MLHKSYQIQDRLDVNITTRILNRRYWVFGTSKEERDEQKNPPRHNFHLRVCNGWTAGPGGWQSEPGFFRWSYDQGAG
jgi:hypothetical protein